MAKVYYRDYGKSREIEAWVEAAGWFGDGTRGLGAFMSIAGFDSSVQGLISAIRARNTLEVFFPKAHPSDDGRDWVDLYMPSDGVASPIERYDVMLHSVLLHKDSIDRDVDQPMVVAWDGDIIDAFYRHLDQAYSVPIHRSWTTALFEALRHNDYLHAGHVWTSPQWARPTPALLRFSPNFDADVLRDTIREALRDQTLTFPTETQADALTESDLYHAWWAVQINAAADDAEVEPTDYLRQHPPALASHELDLEAYQDGVRVLADYDFRMTDWAPSRTALDDLSHAVISLVVRCHDPEKGKGFKRIGLDAKRSNDALDMAVTDDTWESLEAYLETFGPVFAQRIHDRFQPRHQPGDPVDPVFETLERPLYPVQKDVAQSLIETWRDGEKTVMLVGEMGVGKTAMASTLPFVHANERPFRTLIMCPGHLTKKWVREIKTVLGNRDDVDTMILENFEDVIHLRDRLARDPETMEYYIISKDRAKLSYYVKPGANWNERRQHWTCPDCGSVLRDEPEDPTDPSDGLPWPKTAFEKKLKGNATCPECQTPLWQADNEGPRRYAPAEYIKRYLPNGVFDYFIADECHQYKGRTAQGNAFGAMCAKSHYVLAMTGTLMGGYATDLYWLLYRMRPHVMLAEDLDWGQSRTWSRRYGVLETSYTEYHDDDYTAMNRSSRGRKSRKVVRERPGISPLLFARHLLGQTAFIELDDLDRALPPYQEDVAVLPMADQLKQAYKAFQSQLKEAMKQELIKGSKKLLGAYLQSLLAYADAPWDNRPVIHPDTGDVVAQPLALSDDVVYPKEQLLVNAARAEVNAGRRCVVYCVFSGKRDMLDRLKHVLEMAGMTVAVLRSKVRPTDREQWVEKQVRRGVDVLITHPRLVETGLDLLDFPSLIWYSTGYSIFTLRQASRRSWRLGQTAPVRVRFLAYKSTLQESALTLMGTKLSAAMAIEGKFSSEGLQAMSQSLDLTTELAKAVVDGLDDDLGAESAWRQSQSGRLVVPINDETQVELPEPSVISFNDIMPEIALETTDDLDDYFVTTEQRGDVKQMTLFDIG